MVSAYNACTKSRVPTWESIGLNVILEPIMHTVTKHARRRWVSSESGMLYLTL